MKIIDFTHTIEEEMPVYPGTGTPKLHPASSFETDGFRETLLTMFSHTGTHMDAPSHIFENGVSLDKMDCCQFIGSAVVMDCTDIVDGKKIDISYIDKNRFLAERAEFLLFRTGWDKKWGSDDYFKNYPCITDEVANFIISTNKKGVGFDLISVDPIDDSNLTIHKKLLSQDTIIIIENLCNLEHAGKGMFTLVAAPIKFSNSDGAPIRALGILD